MVHVMAADVLATEEAISSYGIDPDSKIHGANMGPTWVLSAPDGPHVGPREPCYQGTFLYRKYMMTYMTVPDDAMTF